VDSVLGLGGVPEAPTETLSADGDEAPADTGVAEVEPVEAS
jgi:hypothetical protein